MATGPLEIHVVSFCMSICGFVSGWDLWRVAGTWERVARSIPLLGLRDFMMQQDMVVRKEVGFWVDRQFYQLLPT